MRRTVVTLREAGLIGAFVVFASLATFHASIVLAVDPPFLLLNQTDAIGGYARNDLGIVGQVFKPENTGVINRITMRLSTFGSSCKTFHARIYDWLGGGNDSPADAKGTLLAESDGRKICDSTAYPNPIDFVWDFTGANEILLTHDSYYFLEIDFDDRATSPAWTVPNTLWRGSLDGSLIDGRAWAIYKNNWQSPPEYSNLQDLYLIIDGSQSILQNLKQLNSDGSASIAKGDTTTEDTVTFQALLDSSLNNPVKLQVELRKTSEPFTGNFDGGILESDFVSPGSIATISQSNFVDAPYHWRARAVDIDGNMSDWQEFGAPGNVDFFVDAVQNFEPNVFYNQPADNGSGYGVSNWYDPIIASTFRTAHGGLVTSVQLYVRYTNCRLPIRAKIFTVSPEGVNGTPDTLIATSLNAPDNNDFNSGQLAPFINFYPITWQFDGTVALDPDRVYALVFERENADGNCSASFLLADDVTNSKIYRKHAGNWVLRTTNDFKMTIRGNQLTSTLAIISPTPNQVFPPGTTSVLLEVDIDNNSPPGHWHWQLGTPFTNSGPAGGNMVTSGNTTPITELGDGQTYTVYVTLVDGSHNVLSPPVTRSVTFSIESASQQNQLPTASFVFSTQEPKAGKPVVFNASGSYDPDGEIVRFGWDWDSDGTYDEYTQDPITSSQWALSGVHPIRLAVTDNKGAENTIAEEVTLGGSPTSKLTANILDSVFGIGNWFKNLFTKKDQAFRQIDEWLRDRDGDGKPDSDSKSLDWLQGTPFRFVQEADLVSVLEQTMEDENGGSLGVTYLEYISTVVREQNLVEKALLEQTPQYPIDVLADLAISQLVSLPLNFIGSGIEGLLAAAGREMLSLGIPGIQTLSTVRSLGKKFKGIDDTLYFMAISGYFLSRSLGSNTSGAWGTNEGGPKAVLRAIMNDEELEATREYFEGLWQTYVVNVESKYGIAWDALGLNNKFKQDLKATMVNLILFALEKHKGTLPDRIVVKVNSPVELRVYDSQGLVTGLVNGATQEDIPYSVYDETSETITILSPSNDYFYELVGTAAGTYDLMATLVDNGVPTVFEGIKIPTNEGVVHRYSIQWEVLAGGDSGVTVAIDERGDGVFETTLTSDNILTSNEFILPPTLTDVTEFSRVDKFSNRFNRRTGQLALLITWSNIGSDPFHQPLQLVITAITPASVTTANADGITDDGYSYYDFSALIGDGVLQPGETSTAKQVAFNNPSRVRFSFDVELRATVENEAAAPSRHQFTGEPPHLHFVIPSVSVLGQNFPNPFNPETWIPYELAEAGVVSITIYDVRGRLVRTLNLGQREAGTYLTRGQAAYWDGHNEDGEWISSGVYLYVMRTGDLTATRKMIIMR